MIIFLIGSMILTEDVQDDATALPDIKVVVDISSGLSSICTCPEAGCDSSACRFMDGAEGVVCTGSCSAGDLLCDVEDMTAPAAAQQEAGSSSSSSAQSCSSPCLQESKAHSAADYDAWLQRALSR